MRILLAVDGSPVSFNAADFLTRLPWPEGTELTVVTVIVDAAMGEIDAEVWLKVRETAHSAALENYAKVAERLSGKFAKVEHALEEGHPNRAIMEVAKRREVDLIVLGARGHSLVTRALLGSTSDYIANHARCPVLVVRPRDAAQQADSTPRILLAYDGSAGAKVAAAQLFALPWCQTSQIKVVTLLERPHLLPDDEIYDADAVAASEKNLTDLIAQANCAANVSYKVRESAHVGDSLSHLACAEDGDLVFVGETGKSALAQFFLGSAARHILHHSPCSVWVARNKQWH